MTSLRPPEKLRSDTRLPQPGRNSSSVPARTWFLPFPDKCCRFQSSKSGYSCKAWQLPVSIPEKRPASVKHFFFSYPIPTHSKHNLIALSRTKPASPRQMPTASIAAPQTSRLICKTIFFNLASIFIGFNLLFLLFLFYSITLHIKSMLRTVDIYIFVEVQILKS